MKKMTIEQAKMMKEVISNLKKKEGKYKKKHTIEPIIKNFIDNVKHLDKTADIMVIDAIEVLPHLFELEFENVTYIQYSNTEEETLVNNFGYRYINIQNSATIKGLHMNEQFDVILGNPPYDGTARLHQQFFNKAVNWCKEDGKVVFIQPSITYVRNTFTNIRDHDELMIANVLDHQVDVKMYPPSIFKTASIYYDLSLTTLTKTKTKTSIIENLEYSNGDKYDNIDIKDINIMAIEPKSYSSMRNKIKTITEKYGSFSDRVKYRDYSDPSLHHAGFPLQRGNKPNVGSTGVNITMFTFYKEDFDPTDKETDSLFPYCYELKGNEKSENLYRFLMTDFARMCLVMSKYNNLIARGNVMDNLPKLDFSRAWTDEDLYELFNITDEEQQLIKSVVKKYHTYTEA